MHQLRLSRAALGQQELDAVAGVMLDDGYLGMGREVDAFEHDLAKFLGVRTEQVVSVNSGTAALHLAVEATVEAGDEVLLQSLTFAASAQAILAAGAVPVLCDVRFDTATIDLEDAKRHLSPKTRAIMPVHYAGNPGDLDDIYAFAKANDLRVIEDAAHAFGCAHRGRLIGSVGDVTCFSFDGIKNITCGEGGALVSADDIVTKRARNARKLGIEQGNASLGTAIRSYHFDIKRRGYRYHMSNLNAALGRVQLKRFNKELAPKRNALSRRYRARLENVSDIVLLEADIGPIVPHIQPVRVLAEARDMVRNALEATSIETGIHYKPIHLLSLFAGDYQNFPVTMALYRELLTVPLHPKMGVEDVDHVCDTIVQALSPSTAELIDTGERQ